MTASIRRPSWFQDGKIVVSSAASCGINKDGIDRVEVAGADHVQIPDRLWSDVEAIIGGNPSETIAIVDASDALTPWRLVPNYFNPVPAKIFDDLMIDLGPAWDRKTIGQLIDDGWLIRRDGHGSPSKDLRSGTVPYIKVSDLRAGLVNINPTNMVSEKLARRLWRGTTSGLLPFDLLSPERASSNIGEFCMLLPGQEQIVLTREVIVLRTLPAAPFDSFYLAWALGLQAVRVQWRRLVFMQTNREDVGHRYKEIELPIAPSPDIARTVSEAFRAYYTGLDRLRESFASALALEGRHHMRITGAESPSEGLGDLVEVPTQPVGDDPDD